ncbi:hypothetical protein HY768_10195 [candidate division TA06 bacterium]|uniref:Uncharacterized protein n=1 Tax=candidate division TA06 bacterium TaxID=2250710 RepID=A0A933MLJ4_UNCT6|nr:hypothetical protein [candidate division TA06 bacterium]
MKKISLLYFILSISSIIGAFEFSGTERVYLWNAQPGQALSYKNILDLRLAGSLKSGWEMESGARLLFDQESWQDTSIYNGLSKKYLTVKNEVVNFTAGNFYGTLGRGLSLSCVADEKVKIDRDIEGAQMKAVWGDWLEAKILAGRIRENLNWIDSAKTYAGTEIKLTPFNSLALGGIYLRANAGKKVSDPSFAKAAEECYGGHLALAYAPADLYAEYLARRTYGTYDATWGWIGVDDVNGQALYAAGSISFSGLALAWDVKNYRDFDNRLNAPPACNREGRLLNDGYDEQGGQVDITAAPWDRLEISANCSQARSARLSQKWRDAYFEGRWKVLANLDLLLELADRREENLQPDLKQKYYQGGRAGGAWRYGGNRSIAFKAGADLYDNYYFFSGLKYTEYSLDLSWNTGRDILIYGSGSIAGQKVPEYQDQNRWGEAGISFQWAQGRQKLTASAGQSKGGLVCSGGFCRYEPSFRGMKAAYQLSF